MSRNLLTMRNILCVLDETMKQKITQQWNKSQHISSMQQTPIKHEVVIMQL